MTQNSYKHKLRHFLTKLDIKVKGDWGLYEIKLNEQIKLKTECNYEIDEMEWMDDRIAKGFISTYVILA